MPIYSIDWNQVTAGTRNFHIPAVRDNYFVGDPLNMRLKSRVKKRQLGRVIVASLRYRPEGGGGEFYSGTDQHNTEIRNSITAATFSPKNCIVPIAIDESEELDANTPDSVWDLIEEKMENAQETMTDLVNTNYFNDGSNAKAIGGLRHALPLSSGANTFIVANTYGGIPCGGAATSADANGWWQSNVDTNGGSHYTTGDAGASGSFMQSAYNPVAKMLANIGIRSGKKPSLIVSNYGAWTDYHNSIAKNERYDRPQQNTELAKAGFENLMYRTMPWVTDSRAPRGAVAANVENVYLIDEQALTIYWDPRRDFFFEPWRKPYNQSTRVSYIKNRFELCFRERRSSGVITVTAAL